MRKRLSGLYLVVDPTLDESHLLGSVEEALMGGVDILQIWNPWREKTRIMDIGRKIMKLAKSFAVPLIMDNELELAKELEADGLHLEDYTLSPEAVRDYLGADAYVGYTCGNDITRALKADEEGADYLSFCAIFPSPSVVECEIVPLGKIRETKLRVRIPIFASGGITAQNAAEVINAGADGIAVISAVLKSSDPQKAARELKDLITEANQARIKA